MKRNIIQIDEEKCDGCGQCVTACHEGAIAIIDGKARLVSETYCDGLGACLGECPQGAITMEEREAAEFDEKAVAARALHASLSHSGQPALAAVAAVPALAAPSRSEGSPAHSGCPGMRMMFSGPAGTANRPPLAQTDAAPSGPGSRVSALAQWPIQLRLVSPRAPYFQDCDLLVAADCAPFAMADFHERLLAGRALVIACPKLDTPEGYLEKLTAILRENEVRSVTVAIMEVPCCRGLSLWVRQAIENSGKAIPLSIEIVPIGL